MVHYQTQEPKSCSSEIHSELAVCPSHCYKDGEHHFIATTAKAIPELHIPHQSLRAGEKQVWHTTSPYWHLCQSGKEVFIAAFQDPPEVLMPHFVVPSTDTSVLEVLYDDQGL